MFAELAPQLAKNRDLLAKIDQCREEIGLVDQCREDVGEMPNSAVRGDIIMGKRYLGEPLEWLRDTCSGYPRARFLCVYHQA